MAQAIKVLASYWDQFKTAINGTIVNDNQISGVQDDGSVEGVLRTKETSGRLLLLAANRLDFNSVGSLGASAISRRNNYWENIDGSNSAITMTTFGAISDCAVLNTTVFGRTVGIRFRTSTAASQLTPVFSVVIDGVAYPVGLDKIFRYNNNRLVAGSFRDNFVIIADNLPDTEHTVQIILNGDPTVSKTLIVYGLIVEDKPGYDYSRTKQIESIVPGGLLTDSFLNINTTNNASYDTLGIKGVFYRNTDSVEHTVTVVYNLDTMPLHVHKIAAGDTWFMDLGKTGLSGASPTQSGTLALQHKADVNSKINFFTLVS